MASDKDKPDGLPDDEDTAQYDPWHHMLEGADTSVTEADDEHNGTVDSDLVKDLTSTAGRGGELERQIPPLSPATTLPGRPSLPGATSDLEHWERLAEQLAWEAAATTSARRAAMLLYEIGRIHEVHLVNPDIALATYQQSHERFPGLAVNSRALVRLLRGKREFAACIPILEHELNAVSSVDERVAILTERAWLRTDYLSDLDGALEDLIRAQKMAPEDSAVLEATAAVHRRAGEMRELGDLYHRRSRSCEDPELTSALICEVAYIREKDLQDTEGAATLYRTALNTSPSNLHALHALLRTARLNRDFPAMAKLCEALAELEQGPGAAAAQWTAARIYRDRLHNSELAIAALERACAITPEDQGLCLELIDLYERQKIWDKLATATERAANLSGDKVESGGLFYKLARTKAERLQDPDGAIEALRQAITLDPDQIPARKMLGRLYTRRERFEELAGLLSDELEFYSDPGRKATTCFRIGNLYETKLNDLERAAEAYLQALEHQPDFRLAIHGLSRVYGTQRRYEDLIASYERELAINPDREDKILLLRRISDTWERRLNDPAAALSSYERLVAIDPSNLPALRALHRLYALGGRWQDLVGVLKTDADQAMDRWRRVTLLTEAAEVQQRQLEDSDAALQTYLEVLELAPSHQPALMAAGRILYRAGHFEQLLELHNRELEHTEDHLHSIWLLMKIGRLLWEKLGRDEDAAAAYSKVVNLINLSAETPTGSARSQLIAAADQLVRIYQQTGDHSGLLQTLQKMPVPESGPARSRHHLRIAEVLQRGQRPALAIDHLRRAIEASDDDAALHQLAQIYNSVGDRQSLIGIYQIEVAKLEDPVGSLAAYHKLASLWGEAEYDLERAVEALEQILEIDPRNRIALYQLELQLARLKRWGKLTAVLELSREPSDDMDHRVACSLVVAALKEDRLEDLVGAAHSSFQVLERYPTHPEALSILERHYRLSNNPQGLIQILGRQLKMAQSTTEQAAILSAMGSAHGRLGDLKEAQKVFRMAAETLPGYLPGIRGLARASRALGDSATLAQALEMEGAASLDPVRKARLYLEAGKVWRERVENQEAAIASLWRVLEIDPVNKEAKDALASLFTARKEWQQLVTLFQRWVEHMTDRDEIKRIMARIADLQRSRLGETGAARQTIFAALEMDANDQALLTTLAELCRAEGDWRALSQVDLRLLELTSDPVLLKALHFELGKIWEDKLPDVHRAIAEYRRVLELDPNDLGALTRLSTLLLNEQDWREAARVTELLLQRDDDRNRVKGYHLRLARIFTEGFNDMRGAIECCRRALSLDPGDLESIEVMARLLVNTGDRRALDAHLASTLAVHRARLDRDPFRMDSYQALISVFQRQHATDALYVVRSLMCVIGGASAEDKAFVGQLRDGLPPAPERPMTAEEIEELLVHPDERGPLYRVLIGAEGPLRKLFPPMERSVAKPEKVTVRSHPDLAGLINRLKKAVGGVTISTFLVDGGLKKLRVEDTATPTLYVGREIVTFSHPELSFVLARKIAHVRLRHMLYARFKPLDLGKVVATVLSVICRSFSPPYPPKELEEMQINLNRAVSKRARRVLESPSLELSDRNIDPGRWRVAMEQSEDRVALALCGDLQAALHCLLWEEAADKRGYSRPETPEAFSEAAGPRVRQLLSFAISEEYLTLRERLGIAAGGNPPQKFS